YYICFFFFSSRRRHTRFSRDWSSDVCSSDLPACAVLAGRAAALAGPRARLPPHALQIPELDVIDALVVAAESQELLVGSPLDDAPLVQHDDLVGVLHGRDPVGDDEGGPPLHQLLQRDRKSTRLNSSHVKISYAVFCLKK